MPLRIVFMGTPDFARASLEALLASGHEVVAVVSQPDRPKGRGQALARPPVAELAAERGLPLLQTDKTGTREFREWVASHRPDLGVVAAFGHLLGPRALAVPRLGCINVHASLLPRWRGASPITMAILHGDAEAGVAIMRMDVGMDTGATFAMRGLPVAPDDTTETLHDKLAALGGALLVETLAAIDAGTAVETPQPELGVTLAPLLTKDDAWIDWTRPAATIERRIRAFHPWPGTRTLLGDKVLRLLPFARVVPLTAQVAPGTVIEAGLGGSSGPGSELVVATGDGALALGLVQLEGKKALAPKAFLAGHPIAPGTVLGARTSPA